MLFSKPPTGRSWGGPAAPDTAGERGAQPRHGENKQPAGSGSAEAAPTPANKDVQQQNLGTCSPSSAAGASLAGHLPSPGPPLGSRSRTSSTGLPAPGGKGSASPRAPGGMPLFRGAVPRKAGPLGGSTAAVSAPSLAAAPGAAARGGRHAAVGCSQRRSRTPPPPHATFQGQNPLLPCVARKAPHAGN